MQTYNRFTMRAITIYVFLTVVFAAAVLQHRQSHQATPANTVVVDNLVTNNSLLNKGSTTLTGSATPATPASGLALWEQPSVGRGLLWQMDPNGLSTSLQPFMGHVHVTLITPNFGSTGIQSIGVVASIDGTPTGRTTASTNFCQSLQRMGMVSASTASSATGLRIARLGWWLGNGAGLGGFYGVWRFNVSDAALVATGQMFAGMRASAAAFTDVGPSTLTNVIGVGNDNGDTDLQLYASGAAAQPKVDLGANFPAQTTNTDVYELALFAPPNASSVQWQVTRLNTGDIATGTITAAASLPSNTTFLEPSIYRSNGGTAAAVGVDFELLYLESQN